MVQDSHTVYKLIILYMLSRVTFPLTKTQISYFMLGEGYTNYLTLQQIICELIDADMVSSQTLRNRTHLTLTEEGEQTLSYFSNRISDIIKNQVDNYLKENELELRNEVSIMADYYKSTHGEYEAHLIAKEKNVPLVDITLSVPTEEVASSICDNWQKKNQEIYQYLVQQLF